MSPSNTPASTRLDATTLYLVRHGETNYNRDDIMQGSGIDEPLNTTGRRQSEALAQRLASVDLDVIYTSPMQRTEETADIVAQPHAPIPRERLDTLREMGWGVLEGEGPSDERDATLHAIKTDWRAGNFDRAVEGGESIHDVAARARHAIEHITTHEAGKTVLVVTHGRYLRVFLSTLLPEADLYQMHTFGHSNTCVNRVVHRAGAFEADLLNCTLHLDNAPSLS
jgi:probable phosphoglycerate mutase